MHDTIRINARPLTRHEAVGVRHLLTHSALYDCAGRPGRLVLHTNLDGETALTVGDLDTWSWSTGERLLIAVIFALVGEGRIPGGLDGLDLENRLVVQQALAFAIPTGAPERHDRLLAAVEATELDREKAEAIRASYRNLTDADSGRMTHIDGGAR